MTSFSAKISPRSMDHAYASSLGSLQVQDFPLPRMTGAASTKVPPPGPRHHPYRKRFPSDRHNHGVSPSKHYQRKSDDHDTPALLNRLSNSPASPPTATLLDRIGFQAEEGETSIDGEYMPSFSSPSTSSVPGEVESRIDKPVAVESGEVERFLESVLNPRVLEPVGRPMPVAPETRVSEDVLPALAKRIGHERLSRSPPSRSTIQDVQQTQSHMPGIDGNVANDNLPNQHNEEPVVSPSATVFEQCRTHLAPVVLASVKARDSHAVIRLEQCATLLSDDRCATLLRHARDVREQLRSSSRVRAPNSPRRRTPEYWTSKSDCESTCGHLAWGREEPESVVHAETQVRRDSDVTLVETPDGIHSPTWKGVGTHQSCHPLPKVEDLSPVLTPAKVMETDIYMHSGLAEGHSGRESMAHSAPSLLRDQATVQQLHLPAMWSKHNGPDIPCINEAIAMVSEDLFSDTERLAAVARIYCLRKGNLTPRIDFDGSFAETLEAIQNTGSQWPQTGSLIIQVNPGFPHGKTWLPYTLESPPFLDVSSCIVPGENILRWVSLSPMSEFVFVLCALPLPLSELASKKL